MKPHLLICTDLDRTLLPNGLQPESPGVREMFARLVSRKDVDLTYVSGRDLQLVLDAMESYRLPRPRFIIADVGSSIHESSPRGWLPSISWQEKILQDWAGCGRARLVDALDSIDGLTFQESARQGAAKLSYFIVADGERLELEASVTQRLERLGVRHRLVWSTDDVEHRGLLDVLPPSASKFHAIEFVIDRWQYSRKRILFAGDSGNDMEVLISALPAVLVANAAEDVRTRAVEMAARAGQADMLYLAKGGVLGTNGNYGAGILEGVAHFFPETVRWMQG